jgi:hypothetical protein
MIGRKIIHPNLILFKKIYNIYILYKIIFIKFIIFLEYT